MAGATKDLIQSAQAEKAASAVKTAQNSRTTANNSEALAAPFSPERTEKQFLGFEISRVMLRNKSKADNNDAPQAEQIIDQRQQISK